MEVQRRTHTRRTVLLSFWLTVLLGAPFWYYTTRVSRATLPPVPDFGLPRPLITLAGDSGLLSTDNIVELNRRQDELEFRIATDGERAAYAVAKASAGDDMVRIDGDRIVLPADSADAVGQLLSVFQDERRKISAAIRHDQALADIRAVKIEPSYDIVFSLLNGEGPKPISSWPIADVLNSHFRPTLDVLDRLANFSTASQIQLYAELTIESEHDVETGRHYLDHAQLANFINSAEWSLATASREGKPLNMIVYVPKRQHRPLYIRGEDGKEVATNSFLLPQFGAVVIHNPADDNETTMSADVLRDLLDVALDHFLTLIGLPQLPAQTSGDGTFLQLDGLYRTRAVEACTTAKDTLDSIHKIVNQIPNMHVPPKVAVLMVDAIDALRSAHTSLSSRGDAVEAMAHAQRALHLAERAFFDDQMVSLLYFPDEHKYGVYMPLFGPVFIPLLLAIVREVKMARRGKAKSKAGSRSKAETIAVNDENK